RFLQLAGRGGVRHARPRVAPRAPCRARTAHRRARGVILRLAVVVLTGFLTLPTAVVIAVSFNPGAILAFPPAGLSLRWYVNVLTYPQFQRAALNSLVVTIWAVVLALPAGAFAALALERARLRGRHLSAAAP